MKRSVVALLVLGALIPTGSGSVSAAIAAVELGPGVEVDALQGFRSIVVTPDYVFLSEGWYGSRVAIMHADGSNAGTITGEAAPVGLAVEGANLYVLARDDSAISVYDISSLPPAKVDTLSTLPVEAPTSLALADGRLWFTGLDPNGPFEGALASMTTAGEDLDIYYPPTQEYWQYAGTCGSIDRSVFSPDRLFVHGNGCGLDDVLYLYDASTVPPTELSTYGQTQWGGYGSTPVAALPDGSGMLVSGNDGLRVMELDALTGPVTTYVAPSDWRVYGSAVATAPPNLIAANGDVDGRGVMVWQQGNTSPTTAFRMPTGYGRTEGGLAFSPDGSRLYMVSLVGGGVALHTVDPEARGTALELRSSAKEVEYGTRVSFSARLLGAGAGEKILFDANPGETVGSCFTDDTGRCRVTFKPSRIASYRAIFSGTDGLAGSVSKSVEVRVVAALAGRMLRAYGTSGAYRLFHETKRVYYTVTMGPPRTGRPIRIDLEYWYSGDWWSGGTASFDQDATGTVTIYLAPGQLPRGPYRFQSIYAAHDTTILGGTSDRSYFKITA